MTFGDWKNGLWLYRVALARLPDELIAGWWPGLWDLEMHDLQPAFCWSLPFLLARATSRQQGRQRAPERSCLQSVALYWAVYLITARRLLLLPSPKDALPSEWRPLFIAPSRALSCSSICRLYSAVAIIVLLQHQLSYFFVCLNVCQFS